MRIENKLSFFFSLLVFILSANSIVNNLTEPGLNYFSLVVSLIGISGAWLLYRENKVGLKLLNLWSSGQIPYLLMDDFPAWSVEQTLKFNLGFSFKLQSGIVLDIGINAVAIIWVFFVWKLLQQKAGNR